jgi:hypothetical protein
MVATAVNRNLARSLRQSIDRRKAKSNVFSTGTPGACNRVHVLATHRLEREADDLFSKFPPKSQAEGKRSEPAHVARVVSCSLK